MSKSTGRVHRRSDGRYVIELDDDERVLIVTVAGQVREAVNRARELGELPEHLRRLAPVAYPTDEAAEKDFASSARASVLEQHQQALERLGSSAGNDDLSEADLEAWLAALNGVRLVLGSALDVSEETGPLDPDNPRYSEWICYHYLSFLVTEIVDALAANLPPPSNTTPLPDDPWGEPPGQLRWDGTPVPE